MKDAELIERARAALADYDSPSSDGGKRLPLVGRNLIDAFERTIREMIDDGRLAGYRCGARLIHVDLNEIDDAMRPYGGAA